MLALVLAAFVPSMAQSHQVMIETTEGNILVTLYDDTPRHRDNFLKLVNEQFYDSLLFHRVIKNFMIQGGDPDSRHAEPGVTLGEGSTDYTVEAEFFDSEGHLLHPHKRGALAMAREGDSEKLEGLVPDTYTVVEEEGVNGTTLVGENYQTVTITEENYATLQPVSFTNDKVVTGGLIVTKNVTVNGEATTTNLADGTYTFHVYAGTVTLLPAG